MATTTPNYGWDVPTSTDYVKDGATAIETLGDDIDASLFSITNGKNVGAVFIGTTSFTASTAVQVSNVFTSDFDTYQIIMTNSGSTVANLNMQLTLAGTPNATSNYASSTIAVDGTSLAGSRSAAGTSWALFANTTDQTSVIIDVLSPALAVPTSFHSRANRFYTAIGSFQSNYITAVHNVSTAFDGFRLTPLSGNVTGTLRVYGYRKS
jgi:hypothetical protein